MPYKDRNKKLRYDRGYRRKYRKKIQKYKESYRRQHRKELNEKQKQYYRENREKKLEYSKKYYSEHRSEVLEYFRKRYKNPEVKLRQKARSRQKRYGLSSIEYNKMINKQKNKCAVCPTKLSKLPSKQVHVDHDHKTGKVRGLLCQKCNLALGLLKENLLIVRSLLKYLGKYERK